MGSVRRVLPRLLVFAGVAAALLLVLTSDDARADGQDAGLGSLVDQTSSLLSADPVQALTAPLQPAPPSASSGATDPVQTLTAPLQPITSSAVQLLDPEPVVGSLTGPVQRALGPPPTPAGADVVTSRLALPPLPALDQVVAPLGTDLRASLPKLPGLAELAMSSPISELIGTPGIAGVPALAGLDALAPANMVPSLMLPDVVPDLPGSPRGLPVPVPGPAQLPRLPLLPEVPATLLGPTTGSGAVLPGQAAGLWDRVRTLVPNTGAPTGTSSTAGEAFLADPTTGSGPARGPPDDAPSDPSHRGSTQNTASSLYSILPGTEPVAVTRGESWHPGNEVELSNPQPEPSVSPD